MNRIWQPNVEYFLQDCKDNNVLKENMEPLLVGLVFYVNLFDILELIDTVGHWVLLLVVVQKVQFFDLFYFKKGSLLKGDKILMYSPCDSEDSIEDLMDEE